MKAASALDYRELAQRRLPRFLFEYIDGGANAEVTMRRNVSDLEQIVLRQRVLQDVSAIDLRTNLLGETLELPVALGPIGLAGMNARRGEVQAARAAETAGVPFCLSTVSTCTIEEVAGATSRPPWLQLYMIRDRGFMRDLLARARAAKCSVLVFTVDMPVPGARYRDYRTGLAGAPGLGGALRRFGQAALRPAWAWDVGVCGRPHTLGNVAPVLEGRTGLEDFFAWMRNNFDPSVTWADLEWVRAEWKGPLVIKGILDADDAERAKAAGADAIVVSNHGGRQLDGVMSTAQALPLVAERIGGGLPVLVDGGVRSGVDVVRMLALGARGVLLGRAWAYALGAAGEAGVRHLLELIAAEIRVAMALTGAGKVEDLSGDFLVRSR
jgi:L-lactate dehydrogenase (cytochrome)